MTLTCLTEQSLNDWLQWVPVSNLMLRIWTNCRDFMNLRFRTFSHRRILESTLYSVNVNVSVRSVFIMHQHDNKKRYCVSRSICLSVCLSHAGIVSKRMHVVKLFPPSGTGMTRFSERYFRYKIPRGSPEWGHWIHEGWENLCEFWHKSPLISERVQR